MIPGLEAKLAALAEAGETITYGALARALVGEADLPIAKLVGALEQLMELDAAQGRPLRAALCTGRLNNGLPARGFFEKAQALGVRYIDDPRTFVETERARLRLSRTN